MFYSCELLEHHVKMSAEGFETADCFLKQIVTNSAPEFVFIHIQPGSRHSHFFQQLQSIKRIWASVFTVIAPSWKGFTKILQCISFSHSPRGLNKRCSAILYRLKPRFQFSSSGGGINITPSWSCGFSLSSPFSVLAAVSAALFHLTCLTIVHSQHMLFMLDILYGVSRICLFL